MNKNGKSSNTSVELFPTRVMPVKCVKPACRRNEVLLFPGLIADSTKDYKVCEDCGSDLVPVEDYYKPLPKTMIVTKPAEDTFVCPDDLKGCPIAKPARVLIPYDMYNQWIFLANQIPTEWIAYLKGFQSKPNEYTITGMYFPPQKASGAHCEAVDLPGTIEEGTIAAVHSHVSMNVFFSAEDERHFNHPIELVVNDRGEIKANGRSKLECGRFHRGDAEIIFTACEAELALQDELEKKISPDKTEFKTGNQQYTYPDYSGYHT